MTPETTTVIEAIYRDDWARILATLVRQTRNLDAAEDALQEAIARAVVSWPCDGVPQNPAGWVSTTAQRIAIDAGRRATSLQQKLPLLPLPDDESPHDIDLAFGDDRLRLIFTCCHPILTTDSRLALTLRLICGLTTSDIAALFLVPEPTMAARITRAKKKIAASKVPYEIPAPGQLESRLQDVLQVIYLVATAGHTPAQGEFLHDASTMQLALDLTRVLGELIPQHPEVLGLRALVLFAEARKETRLDDEGDALALEHMDRSLWDHDLIRQGIQLTESSLRLSKPDTVGPYALQAAIAACHGEAASYEATDWAQIAALYAVLDRRHPSAICRLGFCVAVSMRDGPEAGLVMVDRSMLDDALENYAMLPAARADMYRRQGDWEKAVAHYRTAADLTGNLALRRWFLTQAEQTGER
ncbi:MAG: hypothetical protein KC435_04785 [Thermomicrobiales bacterium]|nr:hypothetical protein [Thermomicrobiales bacterium]